MAVEQIGVNMTDAANGLVSGLTDSLSNLPGFSMIIKLAQAAGILFIIYIIFLIFKAIIQARQSLRMKKIANNVEEINKKLDILVGKKKKSKEE